MCLYCPSYSIGYLLVDSVSIDFDLAVHAFHSVLLVYRLYARVGVTLESI